MTKTREAHEDHVAFERPSRHARIMRGIVAPVFGLLAVACVAFGALNATVWRPSSEIAASADVSGRYMMTDPGVLSMVSSRSTLVVRDNGSAKTRACVALATRKDAAGWLAGHTYTRITGMSDWQTLTTSRQKASGTAIQDDQSVTFESSDMWRSVTCSDDGHVTLPATAATSDVIALIDTGSAKAKSTVTIHWVREQLPDFATPLYFIAGLLAVMTVLSASVFAMPISKRRKGASDPKPVEPEEITIAEAFAGSWRQLKHKLAPRRSSKPRRRHAAGTPVEENAASNADETHDAGTPVVIDPLSRNLVADIQQAQPAEQPQPVGEPEEHASPASADHTGHDAAEPADDAETTGSDNPPAAYQPRRHPHHVRPEHPGDHDRQVSADAAHSYASLNETWYPGSAQSVQAGAQPAAADTPGENDEPKQAAETQPQDDATANPTSSQSTGLRSARTHAPAQVNVEATSVIDPKELQAYFARWAAQQEHDGADGGEQESIKE